MAFLKGRRLFYEPKTDINVVPLADISLVLLIVFMVTTTFTKFSGVKINLPSSSATCMKKQEKREIVIGVDSKGNIIWNKSVVSADQLALILQREAKKHGTKTRVTIQGDKKAPHGSIVKAMTKAQEAGFGKLVIATLEETGENKYVK